MCRGTRRWGLLLLAVVCGALAAGVVSASGAEEDASQQSARTQTKRAYKLKVDAVAYHLPGRTALGIPVRRGVVAVDPRLIPLGTKLHVPGYGRSIAADVGYAIKGRIIDLWMPSAAAARTWGRRTVVITVFE